MPAKRSRRLVVLDHVAQVFEPGRRYPEREVNVLLRAFYDDYAALRRYLVDEGFLAREDGEYWRSGGRSRSEATETTMFDTILGLPVHALVVHAVVVLVPLAAFGLIAIALVPPGGGSYVAGGRDPRDRGLVAGARRHQERPEARGPAQRRRRRRPADPATTRTWASWSSGPTLAMWRARRRAARPGPAAAAPAGR